MHYKFTIIAFGTTNFLSCADKSDEIVQKVSASNEQSPPTRHCTNSSKDTVTHSETVNQHPTTERTHSITKMRRSERQNDQSSPLMQPKLSFSQCCAPLYQTVLSTKPSNLGMVRCTPTKILTVVATTVLVVEYQTSFKSSKTPAFCSKTDQETHALYSSTNIHRTSYIVH